MRMRDRKDENERNKRWIASGVTGSAVASGYIFFPPFSAQGIAATRPGGSSVVCICVCV